MSNMSKKIALTSFFIFFGLITPTTFVEAGSEFITNPSFFTIYSPGFLPSGNTIILDTSPDKRELITSAERSNFENSASNDDGGEIITSSKKTKIAGTGTSLTASVNQIGTSFNNTGGTNYGALLLILGLLTVIVILARITMRKRGRVNYNRRRFAPQPIVYAPRPQAPMQPQYQQQPSYIR